MALTEAWKSERRNEPVMDLGHLQGATSADLPGPSADLPTEGSAIIVRSPAVWNLDLV